MATPPDTAALNRTPGLSDRQVAEYLRRHPDFLVNHPELLEVLTPPSRAAGHEVVDMQTFMIERLRGEIARLKEHRNALVGMSRRNLSKQSRVHDAVIAMLGATTLERLIEVVTVDFLHLLHLDVVTLCVENGAGNPRRGARASGIRCLAAGTIDDVLGSGDDMRVGADGVADKRVFGAGAGLVKSAALVRLRLGGGAPQCLLALGSRDEGRLRPGQGTELFGFLTQTLGHCLSTWLGLPD